MTGMSVETRNPAEAPARRRRGLLFYVGLTLVLAGLGLLGYVGWQLYGTNLVAQQTQQRVVADLREDWRLSGPAAPLEPAEAEPEEKPEAKSDVRFGKASALLRVPRFGDDYVVPVLEGIGDKELSSGYGHFPGTAGPGEAGNYALAAHRVTHGEPLRDMPKLRPGDEIVVETKKATYTYELDTDPRKLIVTFADVWVIDTLPSNPKGGVEPQQRPGQKLITLTTCAELFHTDNRMIAFGHLVDTTPR
jgi:sortase A